jgi:uncharacterized protein YutE (UPF0331/DUF86 family)
MRDIPERDWKKLRGMKEKYLQIVCGRILDKVSKIVEERGEGNHQTYLRLWKTMRQEDSLIADMFDDFKRSTAILKLMIWYRHKLIDKETLKQFSDETREAIELITQH